MSLKYKLGFGPMSNEVIDSLIDYSIKRDYPLMIIASRNQVDYFDGYVCNTETLAKKIKDSAADILLCRDHCGPGFKDTDKNISFDDRMFEVINTIDADIDNNFDLIHVDVSRSDRDQLKVAESLIDYVLKKNSSIMLEFGSEENLGSNVEESHSRTDEQLTFLKNYKENLQFYTTQTGSLVKHMQVGVFDLENNKKLAEKIHTSGFLFKEHNADYLNKPELQLRKEVGIDALNIAPQLGQIQTNILRHLIVEDMDIAGQWNLFANMVYSKEMWKRWVPADMGDKTLAVLVSGHYFFKTDEYKRLLDLVDYNQYCNLVKKEVFKLVDLYVNSMH